MTGLYEESLGQGKLQVSGDRWGIQYYFPGPDMRYNGTFVYIRGTDIDAQIQAYEEAWDEYQKLKNTLQLGGDYSQNSAMNLTIRLGFSEGICLGGYHMPIRTEAALNELIDLYEYAKVKAQKIQEALAQI